VSDVERDRAARELGELQRRLTNAQEAMLRIAEADHPEDRERMARNVLEGRDVDYLPPYEEKETR
jgi:hypothetical protein